MKTGKITLIAMAFIFLCATMSFGADVAKIGVFDFGKVLEISSAGKAARAELTKQGEKMADELRHKADELKEIKQRLDREALVMNQEMREQKEREYRIKVNDFREMQQRYKDEAQQMQIKHIGRVQEQVEKLIAEIGKTEGYLIIIEKLKGGVWYHPTPIDLTDRIIQKYNEIYARNIATEKNN